MQIQVSERLSDFEKSGFGEKFCPWMVQARYAAGRWLPFEVSPAHDISLSPAARGLHYGIEVFEGMRAFRTAEGPVLFRPERHCRRMAHSARVVGLPPYPESDFMAALKELVNHCEPLLPALPGSFYLRPFMMGTTSRLGVGVSDDAIFFVLVSPFGMATDPREPKTTSVWVSTEFVRAVRGGTGSAKVAGNYASSLRGILQARDMGYENVLFLDALEFCWIEELSGMNFFCVESGVLKTPPLTETILAGVTRESLLSLARRMGIEAEETPLSIHSVLEGIQSGRVSEILACGTGSSVVSIGVLGNHEKRLTVGDGKAGPVTRKLYRELLEVQFGRKPSPEGNWLVRCL